MLVDNKFIIVQIPRCATTSFSKTCLQNKIETRGIRNHGYQNIINQEKGGIQYHDNVFSLRKHFGYKYPVIAVKRDPVESFVSFWKHTLKMIRPWGFENESEIMSQMSCDDVFFFNRDTYDLMDETDLLELGKNFCKIIGGRCEEIPLIYLSQIFFPKEWYHRKDPDIIWFDFNKLSDLEIWVSNRLEKEFKLLKENSSKDVVCNLKIDENLIKKYDEIYSRYQNHKNKKTIL